MPDAALTLSATLETLRAGVALELEQARARWSPGHAAVTALERVAALIPARPIEAEAGYRARAGAPTGRAAPLVVEHLPGGAMPETRARAAIFFGEQITPTRVIAGRELGQVIGSAMAVLISELVPEEP